MNSTIIYYTSNRENEEFERKVRDTIYKNSQGLPIISVSQKPIDFGFNIPVGDVGVSGFNMFRQVQIACKVATTDFVIAAEADCMYPPEYFTFLANKDNVCYRNSNLYVMPQHRAFYFHKPEGATHAQIVGRKFYLETLDKLFEGAPEWSIEEWNFPRERHHKVDVFDEIEYFKTKNPVVQIKSSSSMRHYTRSERIPIYKLPYWGDGKDFRRKYYENH